MNRNRTEKLQKLTTAALMFATAGSVYAQSFTGPATGQPAPAPPAPKPAAPAAPATPAAPAAETGPVAKFFETAIPDAIAKGKFNINARIRYEFVEDDRFADDSHAPTLRTRF